MTVNFDHHRSERTGIDEVILAEPKHNIDLKEAILKALEKNNRVLITRIQESQRETVEASSEEVDQEITWDRYFRTAIIGEIDDREKTTHVAILSGGTSDQPIVEEISFSLRYFGINSIAFPDVGVAGIHRHQDVLEKISDMNSVKIIIVVAGLEGALFSVISGQSKLPMIAVPTSTGYGFGGKGEAALRSALQSCSPGVVAVNIDNGFGAASFVKKMLIHN